MADGHVTIPEVKLPSGEGVPQLGLGTWRMGESHSKRAEEIAALKLGLDLGMCLIDTAEMYADGDAEKVVAEAIAGRREEVFLVSKVLPENATRTGTVAACERSLKRLKTDYLDLYLLHWRGRPKLKDTLEAFFALKETGKIRYWGVSNFDVPDMEELAALPRGLAVAANQVLYSLMSRGIERDLLPWCRSRAIPIMAYSPLEQGQLLGHVVLSDVARRHGSTPAQIALAWVLRHKDMIVIPKAARLSHVRDNRAALDLKLTEKDLADLDRAFPAPAGAQPLAML